MKFDGFDWDEGNTKKIQKHGIETEKVERFFHGRFWMAPDIKHSQMETRFLAIGKMDAEYILLIFTVRLRENTRLIRPISARPMNKREVKKYEEEIAKI